MLIRYIFIIIPLTLCAGCTNDQKRVSKLLSDGDAAMESNIDVASKAYAKALTIDPCLSPALDKLGQINMKRKRFTEALRFFTKAIECHRDTLSYHVNRAYAYYELNQFDKAMGEVQFIIKRKPATAKAYLLQSLIAIKMHDLNSALDFSSKAINLDQNKVEFYLTRARVYYLMKKFTESEADLASAAQLKNNEPEIFNLMAMIAVSNGLFNDALIQIQTALKLSNDNPDYLNNRGYILMSQNKLPEALEDITRSIKLDPDNAYAYRNWGIYYYLNGYFESAIWNFDRSLKMETYVEKVHFYRGMSYLRTGRNALACDDFKQSEKEADHMLTIDLLKPCRRGKI